MYVTPLLSAYTFTFINCLSHRSVSTVTKSNKSKKHRVVIGKTFRGSFSSSFGVRRNRVHIDRSPVTSKDTPSYTVYSESSSHRTFCVTSTPEYRIFPRNPS